MAQVRKGQSGDFFSGCKKINDSVYICFGYIFYM